MQLPAQTDISDGFQKGGIGAFRLIDDELDRVRAHIAEHLVPVCSDELVRRLVERLNGWSGKMIRPGLVLLAGRATGEITDEHIRMAAIVEMIHNATLLHDDVIDEGKKRRGLPTVNDLCGNESAVLLGDFLLSRVIRMCADLQTRFQGIIAAAVTRTCEGELRQIVQRRNWQLSESEYIQIIAEKSGALFSASCLLGSSLAGADEIRARMLADFGLNVGIAFQITDDLIDIVGDESQTGKTLGGDVDKNNLTLSLIHFLAAADENQKSALIDFSSTNREGAVERDADSEKKSLRGLLSRFGSLEYARSRAQEFIAEATRSLGDLKSSDAKDALVETAGFVGRRAAI
jgi:octaprenyl-diphosphate synthase